MRICQLVVLLVGVNAKQLQHKIGAYRKQPYYGPERGGYERYHSAQCKGNAFGLFHGKALGHKLAENKGEKAEYKRYYNNAYAVEKMRVYVHAC